MVWICFGGWGGFYCGGSMVAEEAVVSVVDFCFGFLVVICGWWCG